ncbi:NAD(P)/FAD-dependent oxidoreductase [Rhodococcus sp. HNM0569]|uniref:phytoene desaturase family protein n=1 Tax=Rhodococcus sp. HNM0569 TaxID=2716340 RepID=UPI00146D1902|nr:NAD(P)/FAD-dependent oxidoreductase [Rhodococcus sp. HNM0569]NLU82908.1 NAD(P)/FAD-dependent oxidoreductase [Rhodococcus sp. HNM0569]
MIDTLVVGSGHNALVAACYLADADRSVEVLERDTVLGGAVSTVERFPGYRVDRGSSAHLMIRHTGIVEELSLAEHGLRYVDCDPWAFAPAAHDRPPIVFHRSLDATCTSIARACGERDADAYRRFVRVWGPRSARVMRAFAEPPTTTHLAASFADLTGADGPVDLSRQYLTTGDALLDEYFDDERLKAALAWFGAQSGPPMSEPGTAPMVGFAALMHTVPPGRAIGGSGALTDALVARLEASGGRVTPGDAVTALARTGSGWRATTVSGREIAARTVVAGCHVLTTLDLLEHGGYDAASLARWRRRIRVGPGLGFVVRVGTDALPRFAGATDAESATGLQLLVTERAQLRLAHGAALAGELPPRPAVLGMSFSSIDASVAPEGEHLVTLWSQWHPRHLAGRRSWPDLAAREGDRVVDEMERFAPGFADSILHAHVQSPEDIERELGMIGGNVMHVEMSLDQMMLWRPVPELAQHRVPDAPGLYLTGASTHPGGGVSGASGRSAARLVLRDARGPLRRLTARRRGVRTER